MTDSPEDSASRPASASSAVDRYQQLCQSGALPDLAGFVASIPALDPHNLAALVHVDQRHRHAAGALLPAESYFERFPTLRSDAELALDVVYQEYALKRDAGDAVSTKKYLARFPDLAEPLAMQFELDGAMGDEHSTRSMGAPRANFEQPFAYLPGTVIAGRYKLLEEIGEGGMGTIWVAQQTEPVRRRVAIKLVKPGMDSRQVLSRFEAERQALAMMDHPHIAKVLDGGMTEQGRPYFVMEYVKGEPITQYCDQARLSIQERLRLFVQVCQAVQHAHQKGIIHRDLKPSNILVCPYDGQPVPKVIDFGLAKAMHQSLTEHTLFTAHGLMVGTPLYMSPEQAETNNLDIDTRSDVYSLGVILYELLTGSTPLERAQFQEAAWQEILRLIKEEEPPKPSTRLSGSGSLPTIAAQRSQEPAQLSRVMRGDLDWIVMKSLEKERSRRYNTANGLARDIERYLHDDPVEARPPSAGYRFGKFARRNKAALSTVGLVAVAMVVGTMVSTWQAIRATRAEALADTRLATQTEARQAADKARAAEADQRQAAEAERAEAERQRAAAEANYEKAKAAVDKYFTLVSESTLFDVPGLEPLRKDLLEAALEFYEGAESQRTDDPGVLADIAATHLRASAVYMALDRADDFIAAMRRALLMIDRLQREHPQSADQERKLAGFWRGLRWTRIGMTLPKNLASASQTLDRMEATWKKFVERHPAEIGFRADLAYVQAMIGFGLSNTGRIKEGATYCRKACAIAEKLAAEHPAVIQYRADLIAVRLELAGSLTRDISLEIRPGEAIALTKGAVELGEGLVAEFPTVSVYQSLLSDGLLLLGNTLAKRDPQSAEPALRRARDLAESLARQFPDYRRYVQHWGNSVISLASYNRSIDSPADQAAVVQSVTEAFEARLKERPKDRLVSEQLFMFCSTRARALPQSGDFIGLAERLHQRGLAVLAELVDDFPEDHELFESVMGQCRYAAGALWGRNRADEAAGIYQRAVEIIVKRANGAPVPPEDEPVCANMTALLASIMAWEAHTADIQETCRLCSRATDVLKKELQKDHLRQACLAVPLRRFVGRFGPELKNIPEAEQLLVWSSPIVERTILDVSLLAKTTTNSNANVEDRYRSSDAQRQLCHFLRSAGRLAQALEISLLNLRSFASLASDRPDQRRMILHVLGDLRQLLGARVDELVTDSQVDEATMTIRQTIDVIDKLITKDPESRDDYRAMRLELWNRLSQVLADAGRADETTEVRREFASAAEALMLKDSSQHEFKGELIGTTFDWAMSLASINNDPEGQNAIERVIQTLEARIKKNSKDQMARFQLAALTHRLAERRFARAIDEESAEQYQRRALELFRDLANEVPSDTVFLEHVGWSFHNLGGIARSAGRFDEACDHYQAAADTWSKMAADKNVPQRDGWFKNWEADNLVQLAEVLAAGGQPAEAADTARRGVELCEALVTEYPHNGEYRSRALVAARFLARWLVDAGRPQEAVEPARRQIAVFEKQQADFPQENLKNTIGCAYLTLALSLTGTGQLEEGKQASDKAVELLAGDTAMLNYFAWPLAASKEVKPAVAALAVQAAEQATKAVSNSSSLWNTLGVAQYRAGKWEDAIASLTKAEELALPKQLAFVGTNKHLAYNGFFLSMAHWQLGHKDEARLWYDRSVKWMEKHQPTNVELIGFRGEAEHLLGITAANPSSKDSPQGADPAKPAN